MITPVQIYTNKNSYNPNFGAVIREGAAISIKRRGEELRVYPFRDIKNFFKNLFAKLHK